MTCRHRGQYSAPDNAKISELVDDFYSPVKPEVYLQRRLQPIKEFYQKRIPERVRWRSALQFIVFLASATGASLSYFEQPSYIAIVSAFASAVTSWQEFSDAGRKIERYTGSVRHIKNLMSWWNSLGEVEKASSENIHMLLLSGESIITNEHRAWLSTAAAKRQDKQTGEEGGEGRKEDKNEKDQ
uniref:SMODS and SLOG-associating 2TM effector domain-containing protein n=1 Tax=Hemiselmis tepida TaxID=464990 RepID=A0A7S0VHN4_9CRYP